MESGRYPFIMFGGALGSAKSFAIRAINLTRRYRYPRTTSLIFRRTIPELRENHIDPMLRAWPQLAPYWNASEKVLRLPNGSSTTFASADDEKSVARFMGPEYGDIFIDQGEQISDEWIGRLKERNRQTGVPGFVPQYVISSNPGGISHSYLKRVFVDRKRYLDHERPEDYAFLAAYAWDNVEWAKEALAAEGLTPDDYYGWSDEQRFAYFINRTQYGRLLNAKPPKRRAAMLLGQWDQYDGQYFDCFDPERDPVPLDAVALNPWTPRWISMDWGFAHKTTVYWHAQIGEQTVATYREFTCTQTAPDEIGRIVGTLTREAKEEIRAFYLGGDAWAHKTDEQTVVERLGKALQQYAIPFPTRAHDVPGSRIARGRLAYDKLANKSWLIGRTCPELINCLPDLQHDPDKPEQVLKVDGDDPFDGATYGILVGQARIEVPVQEQIRLATKEVAKTGDMTAVHITALQTEQKAKKGGSLRPIRLGGRRFGYR